MVQAERHREFRTVWVISTVSAVLLTLEQLVSTFREELLGYDPRVAGQNFVYNVAIFLPVATISLLLSVVALFFFLRAKHAVNLMGGHLTWTEWVSFSPALLPIIGLLWFLIGFAEMLIVVYSAP